ncbi:MAG: hypothetical protein IT497_07615 [Ottowia sp.]|nr:hypothetical protein [Ottowia sp.]
MAISGVTGVVVSQMGGHNIGASTALHSQRTPQQLSADANWLRQALGGAPAAEGTTQSAFPGIERAVQKISLEHKAIERDALKLAKNPDPMQMVAHSIKVANAMFTTSLMTKMVRQPIQALDKLTSLG